MLVTFQQTKHFNYKQDPFVSNLTHQLWFDDAATLARKYSGALQLGVKALGMWTADYACAAYDSFPPGSPLRKSCFDPVGAAAMWAALPAPTQ